MADMKLELQLRLQDRMSAALKAALRGVQDGTKNLGNEMKNLNKISQARQALGVRSETAIQREIARTQAAYNRMARSGLLSSRELSRAKEAELRKIRDLNAELGKGAGLYSKLQKAAGVAAGVSAGGYVAKQALSKPMDYDRQLALTANVAFSDRSVTGRIAGKAELDKAVRAAQAKGMGSQEQVLQTLNDLIGSGAMGRGQAGVKSSMALLPTIAGGSSGTGSDPADIAKIVMAAKQNMKMTDEEVKRFISQSITAGNLGWFEIKDMARYLPEQMASAAASGMKGVKGAQDLLAFNQVARISAGTPDQAGNNVVNLLNKMVSVDTQRDFDKQGINLTGSLVASRAKGVGTLDAFMGLVDNVASRNPEYKKLQALAGKQTGKEQQQTFNAMMDIMEQSGIGAVVQDRQAMSALIGLRQNKAKYNQIRAAVEADTGGQIEANMAVLDSTLSAKGERAANAKDAAAYGAASAAEGPLGSLLSGATSLATAFPGVATAAYAAAAALAAVAAAGTIGGLAGGRKAAGVGAAARGVGGKVMGAGRGLLAAGGALIGSVGAMPVAAVGATGFLSYAVGTRLNNGINSAVNWATDGKNGNLGGLIYDLLHREKEPIKVQVEVKNGQIVQSVNQTNSKEMRRR